MYKAIMIEIWKKLVAGNLSKFWFFNFPFFTLFLKYEFSNCSKYASVTPMSPWDVFKSHFCTKKKSLGQQYRTSWKSVLEKCKIVVSYSLNSVQFKLQVFCSCEKWSIVFKLTLLLFYRMIAKATVTKKGALELYIRLNLVLLNKCASLIWFLCRPSRYLLTSNWHAINLSCMSPSCRFTVF